MIRRRYMAWLGSALVAAGALGCNADEEPAGLVNAGGGGATGTGGAGHAGTAGSAGSSGSAVAGGSAGAAGNGTEGADGAIDAGADRSVVSDARVEGSAETGTDAGASGDANDADDAGSKSYALAVGADYGSGSAKLVALDWATKQSAGSTVFPNTSDTVPVVSGGRGFMLERDNGKLVILQKDKPWLASKTLDLGSPEAGAYALNPVSVVSTGAKAYVPLLSTNHIAVVDVDNGALTGQVDLSSLVDAADSDGLVDVFDGAYDAATHRAYFILLNIPAFEIGIAPDRSSHCIAVAPSIIAVDTTNDQLIDLNGDAGGKGFALTGRNPTAFVPDLVRGRLLVVDAGCYQLESGDLPDSGTGQAAIPRVGRGIEAVDLTTGVSSWLYTHTESTRLSGLVVVDATHALLSGTDSSFTNHWYPWDPSNGATHGAEALTMPPILPHPVGGNLVVGITPSYVDGGALNAFVSFNVATSMATTVVTDIFGDTAYSAEYTGWALLP